MLRSLLVTVAFSALAQGLHAQFVSTTNTGLGVLESLAVDPQGNRYVCDRTGNRVLKLDANNTPSVYSSTGFNLPSGLVRMPGGEIYVTNHLAGTVSLIPPGGGPATVYASGFSLPRGLTADAEGNLYVGEYNSQRILKVAPGGAVTVVVGNLGITGVSGPSNRLEHLAIEPTGNLIATIGYSSPGRVYRVALPSGTPTLLATSPDLAGSFAINVNQNTGNIYITGVTGHRILSLTPQGAVSVVSGDGTNATLDGPLNLARFSEPSGITVDPDGNIWISQFNGAVRRIGLQPAEVPVNGLRLWLRADRGLLRNGSTVTQWLDQSGSANHATPTGVISTPQAPSFVADVVNGYPAVRFNGVNTGLSTPVFQTFPSKRGTIFSVVRVNGPSSTSSGGYGTIAGTYYSSTGTTWQFGGYPGQYSFYDGVGNANFNVASNPPEMWGIATFLRDSDNTFQFFKSGISVGGGTLSNNQPSPLRVHVGWNDFTSTSSWEVLNGDIAELIIYDGALTPAELEQVHAYLADKYAFNGDVTQPTASGTTICGPATATLTATGGDAYRWYDSPDATVPLATTATFTTPVLNTTTTYYVANFNGQLQSQRVPVTVTVQLPGTACDDGDACTVNDVLDANCNCAGTPSGTINTTTATECSSYTWAVNGETYTTAGTYTVVNGCSTEVLNLTLTGPTIFGTGSETVCGSEYFWDFSGQTYTQNGTYTAVNGCVQGSLTLTFRQPFSACDDGNPNTVNDTYDAQCNCVGQLQDCNGDAGGTASIDACGVCSGGNTGITPNSTCLDCNGVPNGPAVPGSPCDDGNANTTNDTWSAGCVCQGTPLVTTSTVVLELRTNNTYDQSTWEIRASNNSVVCSGGPYSALINAPITEFCQLPNGCYTLRVFDSGGDGFGAGGGYQLRLPGSYPLGSPQASNVLRIIDNLGNFTSGSLSAIANGPNAFCLPMGDHLPIFTSRDKLDWVSGAYVVAEEDAAVSAQWQTGDQTDDGYEFWFFDPNGSYSYRRFRSHAVGDGFGNSTAARTCHMKINNWAQANHIPANRLMNMRIRTRVNGVNGNWGPTFRFMIDPVRAACPFTKLMDIPGNPFLSCNQTRNWGNNNYIHARPVSGANRYQFRFRNAEGYNRVVTSTNYFVQLNWASQPLVAGSTYDVDVRISRDGGNTWCVSGTSWGESCTLTIAGGNAQGGSNLALPTTEGGLSLWPNPNNGELLTLSLSGIAEGVHTVAVDIFDLTGKRVVSREVATSFDSAQDGGKLFTVLELNPGSGPGHALATGVYLVSLTAGSERYTQRLVVGR